MQDIQQFAEQSLEALGFLHSRLQALFEAFKAKANASDDAHGPEAGEHPPGAKRPTAALRLPTGSSVAGSLGEWAAVWPQAVYEHRLRGQEKNKGSKNANSACPGPLLLKRLQGFLIGSDISRHTEARLLYVYSKVPKTNKKMEG